MNEPFKTNHQHHSKIFQLWCDEQSYHYQSLKNYLEYQFDTRSRLLVVRLDLSFVYGSLGQNDAYTARDYFQRLMNNKRNLSITKTMVGYAWSMEFGIDKGFHFHCIFIFDGARSQQDLTLGHALGQYWTENITNGTGTYYCSNHDKARFEAEGLLGIGMIQRHEYDKRNNLLSIASYLVKEDQLLSTVLPEGDNRIRTFGKGEMPNMP